MTWDIRKGDAEFTSGCAWGGDTAGLRAAREISFPLIRLTVPSEWHHEALVWQFENEIAPHYSGRIIVERVPGGYMRRNDRTISHTDTLLAFPETATQEIRSGTWATVRRARKAGCEVRFYPLDGSEPWIEPTRSVRQAELA